MAWSIVGVGTVAETTTTTLTLTEPAGVANGDLLVACIAYRTSNSSNSVIATGWTEVDRQITASTVSTTSAVASAVLMILIRGASAPSLAFTFETTAPSVALGRIVAYRGNVTTSIAAVFDAASSATTATNTTAVSVAGLTTTQANDLIVVMIAGGQDGTWSAFNNVTTPIGASGATDTTTAPSTTAWRERADSLTATGADTSLAIFDAVRTAAGATGNLTATSSLGAGQAVIATAFKMAPVVAAGLMGVWTGAAWVKKPIKIWTGAAWVTKPLKRWNGSAWV